MPELPEVECTRLGITPIAEKQTIKQLTIRNYNLRWPIPRQLPTKTANMQIISIVRRGKYLVFNLSNGNLIIHLGMSGSLQIVDAKTPLLKHDHFDLILSNNKILRFNDPRRFGCLLWSENNPLEHKLLINLGPEPLSNKFTAEYLIQKSQKRQGPIKNFIMNSQIVVGVGNIYASEALFLAGIHPLQPANTVTSKQYQKLTAAIKEVLIKAIKYNGTTIRDYKQSDGSSGNYSKQLLVYGREQEPCKKCQTTIRQVRLGGRSTYFCPKCQPKK